MAHTSGTADEEDLLRDLLEGYNTADIEKNRSVVANTFSQEWIDGTRHQRWAEFAALQVRYSERAPMFVATSDSMERLNVEHEAVVWKIKKEFIWKTQDEDS
jgi:hypothetical protein